LKGATAHAAKSRSPRLGRKLVGSTLKQAQTMFRQRVERSLPYSPERLFDLVADVERYPEFLRWWITARVGQRQGNVYYTDQVLGLGPFRMRFGSKTVLRRPERIEVTSDEPPFRQFRLGWIFEPRPGPGCKVSLAAELDFRSGLLERIVNRALPAAIADIIEAFEARAHQFYASSERATDDAPEI
jgi:coenzyme Q-binding protein COQ10